MDKGWESWGGGLLCCEDCGGLSLLTLIGEMLDWQGNGKTIDGVDFSCATKLPKMKICFCSRRTTNGEP
jgi:hypothetical protein